MLSKKLQNSIATHEVHTANRDLFCVQYQGLLICEYPFTIQSVHGTSKPWAAETQLTPVYELMLYQLNDCTFLLVRKFKEEQRVFVETGLDRVKDHLWFLHPLDRSLFMEIAERKGVF